VIRIKERVYIAEAPTKIILSGEHSVVYGYPAIVLAVEPKVRAEAVRRGEAMIRVESSRLGRAERDLMSGRTSGQEKLTPVIEVLRRVLDLCESRSGLIVRTSGEVPVAAGLGSSASAFVSSALAAFRALGVDPMREQLIDAAMAGEKMVHGRPSGVDVEVAVSGGALRYVKGVASRSLRIRSELPLVVVNTGVERSTGDMVERFRSNLEAGGAEMRVLLDSMGGITDQIGAALEKPDLDVVGRLMVANHVVLARFGVSLPILDRIVVESMGLGALGAKLTGAGGGGCAIALMKLGLVDSLIARMGRMGLDSFPAVFCAEGARAWSS